MAGICEVAGLGKKARGLLNFARLRSLLPLSLPCIYTLLGTVTVSFTMSGEWVSGRRRWKHCACSSPGVKGPVNVFWP